MDLEPRLDWLVDGIEQPAAGLLAIRQVQEVAQSCRLFRIVEQCDRTAGSAVEDRGPGVGTAQRGGDRIGSGLTRQWINQRSRPGTQPPNGPPDQRSANPAKS